MREIISMKTFIRLAAAAMVSLGASGVSAADLDQGSLKDSSRSSYTTTVVASDNVNWTGFYLGVHAGGGAGVAELNRYLRHDLDIWYGYEGDVETYPVATDAGRQDLDLGLEGLFAGVNVEYKFQRGGFMFAPFADIELSSFEGSADYSRNIVLHGEDEDYGILAERGHVDLEQKWSGTAGVKAGFLLNQRTWVYGLLGATWAEFDLEGGSDFVLLDGEDLPFPSSRYSTSETVFGVTVGAGIETRIGEKTTLSLEGRYTDFDSISAKFGGTNSIDFSEGRGYYGANTSTHESVSVDPRIWTVRAGLKWDLN